MSKVKLTVSACDVNRALADLTFSMIKSIQDGRIAYTPQLLQELRENAQTITELQNQGYLPTLWVPNKEECSSGDCGSESASFPKYHVDSFPEQSVHECELPRCEQLQPSVHE